MDSDLIPGLTVVLTTLSRADLRKTEDRARPGTPRCMMEHREGDPVSDGGHKQTGQMYTKRNPLLTTNIYHSV